MGPKPPTSYNLADGREIFVCSISIRTEFSLANMYVLSRFEAP